MKAGWMTLCLLLLVAPNSWAHKKHDHHHHHHTENLEAHVHGEVGLSLVPSKNQLAIEMKAPGESLLGFEHEPKTDAEKQTLKEVTDRWKRNAFEAFEFSSKGQQCVPAQSQFIVQYDEGHSAIHGEMIFECTQPLKGQKLVLRLKERFERINKLTIEVLPEETAPQQHIMVGDQRSLTLSL